MDPVTAAGLGLGVTSLAFQLLGGCIRGYEIFLDMVGMPAKFEHLIVRMRLEQIRLLNWGEKVGLLGEALDQPSVTLRLHRNLIFDLLLEIRQLFQDCLKIQTKFEGVDQRKEGLVSNTASLSAVRPRQKGTNHLLAKTLRMLEKTAEIPTRLQWALVKQEKFERLVEQLISYNDSIVSLLDRTVIQQIYELQSQSQLAMIQLSNQVDELKQLALAIQVQTRDKTAPSSALRLGGAPEASESQPDDTANFARLARFKAEEMTLELQASAQSRGPINRDLVAISNAVTARALATYDGETVWVEWKEYDSDHHLPSWPQMIGDRVRKLATLLGVEDTPTEFRAPHCLGYFHDCDEDLARYGLIYRSPRECLDTEPLSLLTLIRQGAKPSLTHRVALAHKLSRSIMFLHSVNWLHKGIRSDNVVFFPFSGQTPDYNSPTLSGFGYARPDLPSELTEKPLMNLNHDIYRHPDSLGHDEARSKKSWDIYSLGVVLVEIALWKSIEDIVGFRATQKSAWSRLRKVRDMLLEDEFLTKVGVEVGDRYKDVVRRCITGGVDLGVGEGADEADPEVGADMQQVFSQVVVGKLQNIRL